MIYLSIADNKCEISQKRSGIAILRLTQKFKY